MAKDKDKKKSKKPIAMPVILMEGKKTEPKYIEELIIFLGVDDKTFIIHKHVGSSPKNIQDKAKELLLYPQYGTIFCIFDQDSHDQKGGHYSNLKSFCQEHDDVFDASSVRNFEYWLYLHFKYSSAPIQDGDEILKKLREEVEGFKKGTLDFTVFAYNLDFAVTNAKKSVARFEDDGSDNPMTRMGHFVEKIKEHIK